MQNEAAVSNILILMAPLQTNTMGRMHERVESMVTSHCVEGWRSTVNRCRLRTMPDRITYCWSRCRMIERIQYAPFKSSIAAIFAKWITVALA